MQVILVLLKVVEALAFGKNPINQEILIMCYIGQQEFNSMIEITNPVKSRTVYAKVIGRIPRTYPNNCEVVITGNVARDLCLANKRFFSQLRYSR